MPTTEYIWDVVNDSYLMETDGNGIATAVYTNEPIRFGSLVSQRQGSTTSYYHFDGQSSTRQLTDQTATVTDEYAYTASGEAVATSGTTTNPYRYVGQVGYYRDHITNDVYVRARMYRPVGARWLSRDSYELDFRMHASNLYSYGGNDAVNNIDPSGLIKVIPRPASPGKGNERGKTGAKLSGKCGEILQYKWDFIVTTRHKTMTALSATCTGWIVQKVTVTGSGETQCSGCAPCNQDANKISFTYYEAWRIMEKQSKSTERKDKGATYTDRAFFEASDNTCGRYRQEGEIRFYCDGPNVDVDKWQTNVRHPINDPNNPYRTTSGELHATDDEPGFWINDKGIDGTATREFSMSWQCCEPDKIQPKGDAHPRS